jgi:hypothetical protein
MEGAPQMQVGSVDELEFRQNAPSARQFLLSLMAGEANVEARLTPFPS